MAERVCIRCGANCMSVRTCECGGRAFKSLNPDILLEKNEGHGTVVKPVIHKTLMCDRHKQYLVLSKQKGDYNVYRCTHRHPHNHNEPHWKQKRSRNCETEIRVYGDEL